MTDSHQALRRFYAEYIIAKTAVTDERIADAYAAVRREHFVGPGPWQIWTSRGYISTGTADPCVLYQDILVGLAPERGINNGEPSLHAKCLAAARPHDGDVALHIGAGTGYYTAMLALLVGEKGSVHAFEIEPDIAARASQNLSSFGTVIVHNQSATASALPTADVIYVSAGVTHAPDAWLDALAIGGRLVFPLVPNERFGCMLLITRNSATTYGAHVFSSAAFIPCIGARDDMQSRAVAAALDAGGTETIRSLHRGTPPGRSAWCIGKNWWLSTEEALL